MAAKVEVDFNARGQDRVVKAYEAWEQSIARTNRRLVESEGTVQQQNAALRRLRQAQRAEVEAQKDAARIRRAGVSAQQQFLDGAKKLREQLAAGRITEDEYRAARDRLRKETIGLTQAERDQQAASAKQLADQKAGESITRRNATAVERYREELRELRRLYRAGAIDEQTMRRERARLRTETERTTGAEDRRNRELRESQAIIARTRTANERYESELRDLRRMLHGGRIDQETFNRAVGQARTNLLGATTANTSLIGSLGRTAVAVTGVGSAVGGVLTIARTLRAEYDNLLERQGKAADVQEFIDRAVLAASKNTIGLMTPEELRQEAVQINADTDVPIASAAHLIGAAVTSTGVQNAAELETAKQAAAAAAAYAPEADVETQSAVAGVGASLAKRLGVSPEEAIGFMGKVGLQSKVRILQFQVQNLAPALLSLVASGMDAQSSAALITSMTQEGDFTGETTATAVQNVVGELKERFGDRFTDADGNFDARAALDLLRSDEDMREIFMRGGEINGQKFGAASIGRAKSRMAFERLITPGTMAFQQFDADAANIDTVGAGGDLFEQMVDRNRQTAQAFNLKRSFRGATERLREQDGSALSGIFREGMADIAAASGRSVFGRRLASLRREAMTDAGTNQQKFASIAIEQLRSEAADLRDGEKARVYGTQAGVVSIPGRAATEQQLSVAKELTSLADRLQQLLDVQRAQLQEHQQQRREQREAAERNERAVRGVGAAVRERPRPLPIATPGNQPPRAARLGS